MHSTLHTLTTPSSGVSGCALWRAHILIAWEAGSSAPVAAFLEETSLFATSPDGQSSSLCRKSCFLPSLSAPPHMSFCLSADISPARKGDPQRRTEDMADKPLGVSPFCVPLRGWLPSGNDGWGSARHAPPEASTVAHRKRDRAGSGVLDHRARPGPVSRNQEPESEDVELPLEGYVPAGLELAALWPGSPPPKERECYNHSPDGDSSSDYVNNISAEEDYDEGLPEEEEGITYYIYCPEDDSYLEGMDCNGEEYLAHGAHPMDTDECQDAVEWMDSAGPHPHGHGAKAARTTRMANCPSWRMSPPSWSPTTRKKMVTTVPAKRAARTTTLQRLTGTRVLLLTP
ncbi:PREDICTED: uncharacterized protein LOC105574254 [Cercocebus atys]|uniref:uncharacterized protein LOC105574254 n=1 Tax=Cercocebus atys TaxID=9531 RepID=UPI0005F43090|nr:PREDICTED: uncharacterized protein LOC105574254 [Cercocebus atys]